MNTLRFVAYSMLLCLASASFAQPARKTPHIPHARLQPRFVGDWMEAGASRQLVEIRAKGPKVGEIRFWSGNTVRTFRYYWEGPDQVRVDRMDSHDRLTRGPLYRVSFRNGEMLWTHREGRHAIAAGELRKPRQEVSGDLRFVRIRRPAPKRA